MLHGPTIRGRPGVFLVNDALQALTGAGHGLLGRLGQRQLGLKSRGKVGGSKRETWVLAITASR